MTGIRPYIISTVRSKPARWLRSSARTGPASRRCSRASSALIKPLAGHIERGGVPAQNIAYLPQAAEIDRTFPINVYDMVAMGLWRRTGLFGGLDRAGAGQDRAGDRRGRTHRLRGSLDRDALRRPDAAHAVRTAAAAGCPRDRARRAVQRGRRQDFGRPVRSGAALARRAAHGADRDARHRFRTGELSRNPAARTPAGRVGPYLDRSHAGKPARRAPHVRGLRRTCRPLRRRRTRACRNSRSPSSGPGRGQPRSPVGQSGRSHTRE